MIKRNIHILWAIALLQGMVFYAPVATLYRQAAGLGIFYITLIESISMGLTICLEIPWGWLAERIGYRKSMIICCLLYAVSKVVFWQADGMGMFLLERILLAVVCAGLSGVDSSMLYLSCTKENSHKVFGIYQNLGELGILTAAVIYAVWIRENYRLAALLTILSYGVAAVLALGLREVREPEIRSKEEFSNVWSACIGQLRNKQVLFLILAVALVNETHQVVTVFLSQLQYQKAGMSGERISLAYVAMSLTGLSGGFSARLCAQTGQKKMGSLLMLISSGCCLLLAAGTHPIASVLAVLGLRCCFSLLQPLQIQMQNQLIQTKNRATALSVNSALQDGLGILLNLLIGRAAEIKLSSAMLLGTVLCLTGMLCFQRSFRMQKQV